MNNNQNVTIYDLLTLVSVLLQMETLRTVTNDELMKELQKQDREYLDEIVKKQNKILGILESLSTDIE